ncbi:hypothetical protein RMATCC62417_06239 [Rhizopus microsporus]|nr:hypothetical protein RMATCC62417_06239 [Rhizopus microsporus]
MPPKKALDADLEEKESFESFLTSLEQETDIVSEEEEEDEVEEESLLDVDNDDELIDELMSEEDELIDDSEITDLLNSSLKKRELLKTGGTEEMERDMEEFDNNLALNTGIGKLKRGVKKKLTSGEVRLPEEVKRKLGEANALYIGKDYGNAIAMLQEVITDHPEAYPAWNTLGLVHEELGNTAKSLQLRMVAAHMCNDASLWKELGQKSIESDAPKQAIYCFSKALTLDPSDVDVLWDRSFLYKQSGKNAEAIEGFKKILEIMPHHFKVINEMAQIYRAEGKTQEAIQMYEDAIVYHTENNTGEDEVDDEEEEEFSDKLGYSEINMLSELYLVLNDYSRCLDTIKTGLRLIQHRQHETWWIDHADDDDEYFGDDDARTDFPIELRVRMGVCRVYMGPIKVANKHFDYLLQYPATTYPDLHQDIAYAYYDKRHYELALKVFQRIIDASDEVEVDLLIRTADCYREIGELDTAVMFYINVLEEQPENLDVMVSLATVYEEQGKEEQALDLLEFGKEARRLKEASKNQEGGTEAEANDASKKASIFDESRARTVKEMWDIRRARRLREEQEKEVAAIALFEKLDEIDKHTGPDVVGMDRALMRDYMRAAQELWEGFFAIRAFFGRARSKRFEGFYAIRKGKKRPNAHSRLDARYMAQRLRKRVKKENEDVANNEEMDEEDKQDEKEAEEEMQMSAATHFRTIPFTKWCYVFLRYAFMLAVSKRKEETHELLRRCFEANVFFQDLKMKTSIKLAQIGCGMITKHEFMVQDGARWLCNFYQFQNDPFRIYTAVLNGASSSYSGLVSYPQLKYISRIVRLMDALVLNSKGTGTNNVPLDEIKELDDAIRAMNVDPSANEQNYMRFYEVPTNTDMQSLFRIEAKSLSRPNPIILTLFAHLMGISRNHLAATLFYMRAYAVAPRDPVNTLCVGMSFLQASTQRRCDNRHLLIVQGMLFMQEYMKIMGRCQESEYNMAVAFHLIGLTHLAVPHYERVLCLPSKAKAHIEKEKPIEDVYKWPVDDMDEDEEYDETDLKHEAAYNLHLIYVINGSPALAEILMMKYCTI